MLTFACIGTCRHTTPQLSDFIVHSTNQIFVSIERKNFCLFSIPKSFSQSFLFAVNVRTNLSQYLSVVEFLIYSPTEDSRGQFSPTHFYQQLLYAKTILNRLGYKCVPFRFLYSSSAHFCWKVSKKVSKCCYCGKTKKFACWKCWWNWPPRCHSTKFRSNFKRMKILTNWLNRYKLL